MKSEYKYITLTDWIIFFVSTFLIFLSSVLLVISAVIFALIRLLKKRPLLILASVSGLILLFMVVQWTLIPIPWRSASPSVSIIIKPGDSMTQIVDRLKEAKLIRNGTVILFLSELLGKDRHIQAGRYNFEKGITLYAIFSKLLRGDVTLREVTIPEGKTIKQIAGILKKEIGVDSLEFVSLTTDSQFAKSMGIFASSLEGYLFPETYRFSWGASSKEVARAMVQQFKKVFDDSLLKRAEELNFSLHQVVTLASMIEAEAKVEKERKLISAVFHNRLKRGMLLQCCPTVIYVLPEVRLPLLQKDLEIDSPYNTYKYPGLPPGPICNPGKASLLAALYPQDVGYLYFVSRGDGSHIFSTTLAEHTKAKSRIKQAKGNNM